MNSKSRNNREAGFTLLEVLISIVLLVVISLAIYEATSDTYKLRDSLSAESEFYTGIRLAMSVVDRDVTMLYTPKLMLPPGTLAKVDPTAPQPTTPQNQPVQPQYQVPGASPGPEALDQQAIMQGDRYKGTNFWSSVIDRTGVRMSRFIGTETAMSFISAGHVRVYKDSRESIFEKIAYSLADARADVPEYRGTKSIVRTVDPNAFDVETDDDSFLRRYTILEGVKSLKLAYYYRDKTQWYSNWDSDSPDFKNLYPDEIRVEIEVVGPQNLSFQGNYQFRPEIPFNGLYPTT